MQDVLFHISYQRQVVPTRFEARVALLTTPALSVSSLVNLNRIPSSIRSSNPSFTPIIIALFHILSYFQSVSHPASRGFFICSGIDFTSIYQFYIIATGLRASSSPSVSSASHCRHHSCSTRPQVFTTAARISLRACAAAHGTSTKLKRGSRAGQPELTQGS